MKEKYRPSPGHPGKLFSSSNDMSHTINIAIVGGGRACKFFLEIFRDTPFPYLNINIKGVCDINPDAEGLVLAKKQGISTTNDFHDLFKIKDLNSIIELTGDREVWLEIIRHRPKGVGIIEYNIGKLMRKLFEVNQRLKVTEEQLNIEKSFSDFLIEQSTAAIVIINTDFKIIETNEAYLKAVHKSKDQVIGARCYEISHGYNAPCSSSRGDIQCPMLETLRTGKSHHVIHEHPGPNQKPTFFNLVAYPLRNQEGEIFQVIEVWRDITEQLSYRWEKQVKELKSDLQKLVQEDRMISMGKLAASCAHEINNPIQGLLTFSCLMQEILAEGEPSKDDLEQFKKHIAFMSNELERCGNIVSGLLSFSRQTPKEYKGININDILDSVTKLTQHKMKLKNVDLTTRLYPGMLMVQGDESELQQCFLNLIFNAIEAMPEGGQLKFSSEPEDNGKNVIITIRDTGYGISKENLNHIFDPFFTTKGEGEGTGLGLSIVYGVVKNHKGNIKVDSKVGEGTSFVISFPAL